MAKKTKNVDIAQTLMGALASNPQMLTQFLDHPYSTVQEATGAEEKPSSTDMSQIITALAALAGGNSADMSGLPGLASGLLTSNGGSVHSLVNSLFGTSAQAQAAASNATAPLDLGSLMALAGGIDLNKVINAVDLSDGIGMDDIMNAASALFGGM